jgi:eukaryotic-like serine/threonine-protein kinase
LLQRDANLAGARGQVSHCVDLYNQANEKAQPLGLGDSIVDNVAQVALVKALAGDLKGAMSEADAALKQSQSPTMLTNIADIYARAGRDAEAEKLAARAASERPVDQYIQDVYVPTVRALIAMNHRDAQKAIDLMKAAQPYDAGSLESLYTRGNALLMAGRGADAAQEFQKILNLKNAFPSGILMSYAQLGLARAYALDPDKAKARTAYQDFLAQWKNADPDLPVLKQAQAEYAKLK